MNLNSSREREALRGQLVQTYNAICFFCGDYHTVRASSKAGAAVALRAAEWHTMRGDWVCPGCYSRQQGYRELERREREEQRQQKAGGGN